LTIFVGVVSLIMLALFPTQFWTAGYNISANLQMVFAYIFGSALSGLAGVVGISIATIANSRSATAAREGLAPAYMAGFRGGAVMGMAVVATSLIGAALLHGLTGNDELVISFSFGASSLALFAKAGGGIFTKTADIAADLTGKVELGIPEDDPRNPAVIADNVGDNVGDVAGMGADLFDSKVAAFAASMVLAVAIDKAAGGLTNMVEMLFAFTALGLLASIIGVLIARVGRDGDPGKALNNSTYITCGIYLVLTLLASWIFKFDMRIWGATTVGMLAGVVIGFTSELFTGDDKKPVAKVAEACKSGPAFTILSGISYGLVSALPSLAGIALASLAAYKICEPMGFSEALLGISMAANGMLATVGMIIASDAYGPIVDNARGMAEMANLGDDVLEITDKLDSAGNTAKAITKGFAIGAAGLTVIALLGAYMETVNQVLSQMGRELITGFDIMNPWVFFGILVGSAVPAVFSAMLMLGVNRNSQKMVSEIHRQFNTIPGLKEGKPGVSPEYDKCISIATFGAIRELVPAGLMSIGVTLLVGFIGGVQAMGGYLLGNIVSGLILALLMSNAGGLW
ncbi:MAG: sodium-translocating pyrophosphatase, partial [Clostridiales bacterium]|nr:sodium-translocating pyrophosphatase [Clostridiales bacterium]